MPAEVPLPVRPDPSRALELRGISRGSEMRLFLVGAEVWRGLTFLGIVSAEWFAAQVQERLDTIENTQWLQTELSADPARRLGPRPESSVPFLRKPLAFAPIRAEVKAKRRAQRRKNKGKRGAP
jgi:hypothetical protein